MPSSLRIRGVTDPAGNPLRPPPGLERAARASVRRVLEENVLCALATVTASGRPHVSTAYFCFSEALELWFLSHPDSVHCRNLAADAAAAIAVFGSAQRWGERDRGLQLFGTCAPPRGAAARAGERRYAARFPAYAEWRRSLARDEPGGSYRLYRFATRTLKIFDEERLGDGVFVTMTVERSR
ncbi:MAG TPA: pyridoxamine 5'-phosphate oxidase family protein [Anaeromyxobacteraceae bacterium]|nr:pyridoxamine 5'-phosphate oxidase family protein [Anaeromyxobacteraceae bacterium]